MVTWAEGEVRTDAGCCHFKGRVLPTDIFIWRETHMCIHAVLLHWSAGVLKGLESFPSVLVCEKALLEHLNLILTAFYISRSPNSCVINSSLTKATIKIWDTIHWAFDIDIVYTNKQPSHINNNFHPLPVICTNQFLQNSPCNTFYKNLCFQHCLAVANNFVPRVPIPATGTMN